MLAKNLQYICKLKYRKAQCFAKIKNIVLQLIKFYTVTTKKETIEVVSEATEKKAAKRSTAKKAIGKSVAKKAIKKAKEAKETKSENTIKIIDTDTFEIRTIVDAMLDKKAKNVCSLDLKEIGTSICDYFVICNADSTPNVLAIADNIEEEMIIKCNRKVARMQGKENAFWIILDYSNIVVHIFQTEYREFYRLEDLWADSVITKYSDEE